jgi:hypothetical protein
MATRSRIVAIATVVWLVACAASKQPSSSPPASTAGGATPAAVGQACGTRGAAPCGAGQFCNFVEADECGATDKGGHCESKPAACPRIAAPVCGCDGKQYGNGCEASAAGVGVKYAGKCLIDL